MEGQLSSSVRSYDSKICNSNNSNATTLISSYKLRKKRLSKDSERMML